MEEKAFIVKFVFTKNNIQVQTQSKNITPHESIGLLEMAKHQILENIKNRSQELFYSESKGDKPEHEPHDKP